ncbi:arginase family protein [Aquimarina gracilis]|uniref:Arginase family protein n=1 Tax=Aquimarina gracilis TaxID=874422 RepID=A0ABU5ZWC2_9FLAO|nr:arginase family protein [Aquimarina gracilis]MEB3346174.1 arginase family protein [Aquimarina gracilis]
MNVYFPQWQGSGNGKTIESGANTILKHLNDQEFIEIPLSKIEAGEKGIQKFRINNYDALFDQLTRFKKHLINKQPKSIKTIGGDCGLEIIPVSYLNQKYPNLGIIWFDAHADINHPCDSPSCNFHGMPLRTLLGEGEEQMNNLIFSTINASQIHYIGLRDIDAKEQERIDLDTIYCPLKLDIDDLIDTLKSKKIIKLYLHFDFDCLDPEDYNQTYYNIPNGIKIKNAETYIKALKEKFDIVGSSVLESIATIPSELKPIEGIVNLLMK